MMSLSRLPGPSHPGGGGRVFAFCICVMLPGGACKVASLEISDVGVMGKMVGKDTKILGQLANIGSSKLEANRCQYVEQDVWTFWK